MVTRPPSAAWAEWRILRRRWRSSLAGDCTFAENPAHDCTQAKPIWSVDVNPCALRARIDTARSVGSLLDPIRHVTLARTGAGIAHLVLSAPGEPLRIDIVEGALRDGPVAIAPVVDLARDLNCQFRAIRRLTGLLSGGAVTAVDPRLDRLVTALRVLDARTAGVSLRDIGLRLIGGSEWPGDGEHLKSKARRLVGSAERLRRAGPAGVLAGAI